MKMHFSKIFRFSFITLIFIWNNNVSADIFPECENLTTQFVFIESDRGCNWYIFCNGNDSYIGQCEVDLYFNQLYQTCDPKELVNCRFETSTSIISTTTTPITRTTVRQTSSSSSSSITTSTSVSLSTLSTTSLAPSETTTIASTANPNSTTSTASVVSKCPSVDNPYQLLFLPHPKSCSDYFMCYHGQEIPMHCSAMLHFNVRTSKCDYPENVRCQADLSFVREMCQPYTTDFYPHPNNCNYYYFCKSGYLLLQQCPFLFGWDYERRTCMMLTHAKCYRNAKKY